MLANGYTERELDEESTFILMEASTTAKSKVSFHEFFSTKMFLIHFFLRCIKQIDGHLHGKGTLTFPSGNQYEGEFKLGRREGIGIFIWQGKFFFLSKLSRPLALYTPTLNQCSNTLAQNPAINQKKKLDGERYEGSFKLDKRDGYGIYHYANGDVYKGMFSDGLKHGFGIYQYANGNRYEGNFKQGNIDFL